MMTICLLLFGLVVTKSNKAHTTFIKQQAIVSKNKANDNNDHYSREKIFTRPEQQEVQKQIFSVDLCNKNKIHFYFI